MKKKKVYVVRLHLHKNSRKCKSIYSDRKQWDSSRGGVRIKREELPRGTRKLLGMRDVCYIDFIDIESHVAKCLN